MKYFNRIGVLAGLFVSCGFADLSNDRWQLTLTDRNSVVLAEKEQAGREFDLSFVVLFNENDPELKLRKMDDGTRYNIPTWTAADPDRARLLATDTKHDSFAVGDGFDPSILTGGRAGRTDDLFQAAPSFRVSATECVQEGDTIRCMFAENSRFTLSATVTLPSGDGLPELRFKMVPKQDGYYSAGYVGAPGGSLEEVQEIWQPLIWQEKRFPQRSHLTLAYRCPVPSAFVTQGGLTVGAVADPQEFPFDPLPLSDNSRFGIAVRDVDGQARPMLFAPALGGAGSFMTAGEPFEFSIRLFVGKGNTTDAMEQVATGLYGFRDYRSNALGSLNRVVENITDYGMSHWSLFSEENKGCNYSTDAPGAVKNVSSIDPLDLSIVMDSEEMFNRRAYPYMEYMLSRGKFLFTDDETQKIQHPSYRLNGPAAPVSELCALYSMFHGASPVFQTMAANEFGGTRVRNLDVKEAGDNWRTALVMYRMTGDERYLTRAKQGADEYIAARIDTPQSDFSDPQAGGFFFWTGYAPRYIELLMMYEETGEERYLKAAQAGARRYAQYTWLSPAIPNESITVNKGGKAPEYWYLKRKGHKQVLLPEETVPAWRFSAIGLTPESSGTCAGHRAIFMANHAPWMLKIGHLTGDKFLMELARSAVIGRYRNFPGYHINTARTTAYEKKDFPLCGHKDQSVSSFHYNHVFPMISMLVDYLVTDAFVRSDGQIAFPYHYSEGYAYMQNKAYGAMQGKFFGHNDALLWMPKQLIAVPDQINYISARGADNVYIALMNESADALNAEIRLNEKLLPAIKEGAFEVELSSGEKLTVTDGRLTVPVAARGLTGVIIKGLQAVPQFQNRIADLNEAAAWDVDLVGLKEIAGRAMILNLGTQTRTAYIFLEYSKYDFTKVELVYNDGSGEKRAEDLKFPWEVTVPVSADAQEFIFTLNGHKPDGTLLAITSPTVLKRTATEQELQAAEKSLEPVPVTATVSTAAGTSYKAPVVLQRSKGSSVIDTLPAELYGSIYVQVPRGAGAEPGAAFSFTIDKETGAYIAVHKRGNPRISKDWKKTALGMTWSGTFADTVYQTTFPAGRVEIPAHDGKQGSYYGIPHMVFLKIDGEPVELSNLSPEGSVRAGKLN